MFGRKILDRELGVPRQAKTNDRPEVRLGCKGVVGRRNMILATFLGIESFLEWGERGEKGDRCY